jgi:hypothetical protein
MSLTLVVMPVGPLPEGEGKFFLGFCDTLCKGED